MPTEVSTETALSIIEEEILHHRWYRRFGRGFRRVFMSREKRRAEIDEERRTSQQVIDMQF